ncbi:MAG: OmpA family protein [Thermodesulfovibrionales bacterium]
MKKNALFALLFLISLPVLVSAEIRQGTFEINPFVGYCTTANSPVFCHKKEFGIRVGYNITDHWELEGGYSKVASRADLVGLDILYHFTPEKRLTPFILAGIGNARIRPEGEPTYQTLMGDFGAGFKYSFNDTYSFRSEIRDVVTHSNNVIVSAGLVITLGGKTPKAAPVVVPSPVVTPEPRPEPKPEVVTTAPAPKAEPKPEPAPVQKPETVTIVLEDVHFAHDSSALTSEAKELLRRDIQKLKDNPGILVEIQGHTSAIGKPQYNMKLSIKRANMVKDYLIKEGIAEARLTAKGFGESMPEVKEKRPKKESPAAKTNRRVHFEILIK